MTKRRSPVGVTLLVLLSAAGAVQAQERVLVRRLSDSVAVRMGPERDERVLYYFAPTAELEQGDEVEQGSRGHTEIALSRGGMLTLHATAHLILDTLSAEGDVLDLRVVTRAAIRAGERPLVVLLPGGASCRLRTTQMDVELEPGTLRVRNTGGEPVQVVGRLALDRGPTPPAGLSELVLERGQEVRLPLFQVGAPAPGRLREEWGGLTLRHDGDFVLQHLGERLVAGPTEAGTPSAQALLVVGGVHTRLPGQGRLALESRRQLTQPQRVLTGLDPLTGKPTTRPSPETTRRAVEQLLQWGFTLEQLRATLYDIPEPVPDEPPADPPPAEGEGAGAPEEGGA